MKIKVKKSTWTEVRKVTPFPPKKPKKQSPLLRSLVKAFASGDLKKAHFSWTADEPAAALLRDKTPCLFLMNHSSFTDLEIIGKVLSGKPYHIVTTTDGFVGKDSLLRSLGCLPTLKFTPQATLIKDMLYILRDLRESVVMYPEASYTFDGTATPLPESLGKCCRLLGVPVVMIRTRGSFLRDPLYNNLQVRDVTVTAHPSLLFGAEEVASLRTPLIQKRLAEAFTFDGFREQQEGHIRVAEPFRADCLHRVLYKCPRCGTEGRMEGSGTRLTCHACGAAWQLDEYGFLREESPRDSGRTFTHVPAWYAWEREEVRREIIQGIYLLDVPVRILALRDTSCVYDIGKGRLVHNRDGFRLTGCEGTLDFRQAPEASYSLYADYYWYEIGDMICIGDTSVQFYCFPELPPGEEPIVAKARLAAEELFKLKHGPRKIADQ
ncbi:MAG: hypothetical protein II930_04380 [Lachnospiraceae bacterium]|nr:hypothetical protein [Lachnospiraceae bacterium]